MRPVTAFALALALAAGPACRSASSLEVRVDLPGVSPFAPGSYDEVVVTDFRETSSVEGFSPGRSLRDYLADEIDLAFRGRVSRVESAAPPAMAGRALVLTGSVRMSTEVRKALAGKGAPVEGPWKADERGLIEVRRWTLEATVAILSAAGGEPLWRKDFREERDYSDLEKAADFAFSELAARVRGRLLPVLLGTTTLETRTLVVR
jgi:hypothetical protein